MNRRSYLKALGAVGVSAAVAGCAGVLEQATGGSSEPKHEYVGEAAWGQQESDAAGTSAVATARVQLEKGEYTAEDWSFDRRIATQIEARDDNGNAFEVFVVDNREFEERVRNGESARFYNTLHGTGRFIQVQGTLDPGSYQLVIDNSAYAEQGTEGPIDVEMQVVVETG